MEVGEAASEYYSKRLGDDYAKDSRRSGRDHICLLHSRNFSTPLTDPVSPLPLRLWGASAPLKTQKRPMTIARGYSEHFLKRASALQQGIAPSSKRPSALSQCAHPVEPCAMH